MGLSDAIMVTFTDFQFYTSGGFVYMNKDDCSIIFFIMFVFVFLFLLAAFGLHTDKAKTTKDVHVTKTEKYTINEPIDKVFRLLRKWAWKNSFREKRTVPPHLLTCKSGTWGALVDVELIEDSDSNNKTRLIVSCSGRNVAVDKALSVFKEFIAEMK